MDGLTEVRKLHLDLVQKCIINTQSTRTRTKGFGGQGFRQPTKGTGQRLAIEGTQHDWESADVEPAANHGILIANNIPGDFIETGVRE